MKLYPKSFVPPLVDTKPIVSAQKKTAVLTKMKAYMEAEARGFRLKELIDYVQDELHADGLHVRDDEVGKWVKVVDEEWGWHPSAPVEIEELPKVKK